MLEKGNNQVEIMYLSTSSGKIRFRYDGSGRKLVRFQR